MGNFAVIDTETNWNDQVMSIGCCIADEAHFQLMDARYYVLPEECRIGGMYQSTLLIETPVRPRLCSRVDALRDLQVWLKQHDVQSVFAYNACFDRNHLPELHSFLWHDIMRLAAYRQHNSKIPRSAECCSTGRLKRGYGVEDILRLLSNDSTYCESHNAFFDALDELRIMQLLGIEVSRYSPI